MTKRGDIGRWLAEIHTAQYSVIPNRADDEEPRDRSIRCDQMRGPSPRKLSRLGMTSVAFARKRIEKRKRKRPGRTDLAFKLNLSAGGSLFRIGTCRSRRR